MRAAKVDENQSEIVSFFRKIGCSVALMHTVGSCVKSPIWVGMMNHLKLIVLGLCALSLLFLLTSCANQPSICPEIKVSFCPVK